jgi:hypothetical protein
VYAVPDITAAAVMDAGQFKLQFSGFTNITYEVVGSTNLFSALTNWALLGTATTMGNSLFQFLDAQTSSIPCQFYRVRLR